MNGKGALDWGSIIMLPALVILLVVMFPVLDVLVTILFTTLDASTSLEYINLIKILIGSIGMIFTLGVIWNIVSGLRKPEFQGPSF